MAKRAHNFEPSDVLRLGYEQVDPLHLSRLSRDGSVEVRAETNRTKKKYKKSLMNKLLIITLYLAVFFF